MFPPKCWTVPLSLPQSLNFLWSKPAVYLSILATIFNVLCNRRTLSNAILYVFAFPLLLLTVTKWSTENNSNTRFQCVSQNTASTWSQLPAFVNTVWIYQAKMTIHAEANGTHQTMRQMWLQVEFIAHLRDLFSFYCSGHHSHMTLSSMGHWELCVLVCVG